RREAATPVLGDLGRRARDLRVLLLGGRSVERRLDDHGRSHEGATLQETMRPVLGGTTRDSVSGRDGEREYGSMNGAAPGRGRPSRRGKRDGGRGDAGMVKLDHLTIRVRDLEASRGWYVGHLGMT